MVIFMYHAENIEFRFSCPDVHVEINGLKGRYKSGPKMHKSRLKITFKTEQTDSRVNRPNRLKILNP